MSAAGPCECVVTSAVAGGGVVPSSRTRRGLFGRDGERGGSVEDRGALVIARLHKVGMRRVKALNVGLGPVRAVRVVGCSRRWRRTELLHATGDVSV
jgi:hypothetical protein